MSASPTSLHHVEDTLDLNGLLLLLWQRKRFIILSALLTATLSAIYAFCFAKTEYVSSALLLPVQSSSNSDMSAAAALLGRKSGGNGDAELYQSLLTSRTVIHKLLDCEIRDESDTVQCKIKTLAQVMKIDKTNPKRVDRAIKSLSRAVSVGSKETGTGGILEIRFAAEQPWLAQQIGNNLLYIGQNELRRIRVERSNVIISRLAFADQQAKEELDIAAIVLSNYKTHNRSITLPEQLLEISRLEMEKSAKEQKYLLARKELEVQRLEQAKAAPPMMILDSADVPTSKSKPQQMLIIACGFILGILGSMLAVVLRMQFNMEPIDSGKK